MFSLLKGICTYIFFGGRKEYRENKLKGALTLFNLKMHLNSMLSHAFEWNSLSASVFRLNSNFNLSIYGIP